MFVGMFTKGQISTVKDTSSAKSSNLRWVTLQTRITAFHPNGWKEEHLSEWWEKAFAQQPERIDSKPRENSELVGGPSDQGQLIANASPGRTDFILEPSKDFAIESGSVWPSVPEEYREAWDKTLELVGPWLNADMKVTRMAVGAILILPCPNLSEVYETLSNSLLAIDFRGSNSTPDFQYRINRVRPATKSSCGTTINRLATWSVAQGHRVVIAAGDAEPETKSVRQFAVQLELDINTRPEAGKCFPSEKRSDILSELKEMAVEIAEKGDTP